MKNLSILILTFLIISNTYTQVNGFFGKKNYLDFGVDIHSPLLYNFYSSLNNSSNNTELRNINFGFHAAYSRVIQNNIALGMEGALSFFSVAPDIYSNGSNYANANLDLIKISKTTIMPKVEFAYNDALLPIGVSNQIGLGFNYYKALESDYTGSVVSYENYDIIDINKNNYYDFNNQERIKGYTIMYKLMMRIPLNKSLLYHFGFRYTFNFVPNISSLIGTSTSTDNNLDDQYILSKSDIEYEIKVKENRSLIMFETGITFAF